MRALAILAVAAAILAMAISLGAVAADGAVGDVPASEDITISEDTVIAAGETVTVDGSLVVAEGATLTVEDGGKLRITETGSVTVDGTLVCGTGAEGDETLRFEGESLVINGTALFEGNDSLAIVNDRVMVINGEAEITGESWETYNIEVNEGATATIGNCWFEAVCHGTIIVETGDWGGVSSVQLGTGGTVVVEALDRIMLLIVDGIPSETGGEICMSAMGASGFSIECVPEEDGTSGFRLSGEIRPTNDEGNGGLLSYGDDDLSISDLSIVDNGYLQILDSLDVTIEGDMTAPAGSIEGGTMYGEACTASITVTGSLTMTGALGDTGLTLNAAQYTDADGNSVYVPLETALASGADAITMHGANSIDDPSMLEGITVTMADGATLSFGETPRTATENGYLVAIAILVVAVIALAGIVSRRREA